MTKQLVAIFLLFSIVPEFARAQQSNGAPLLILNPNSRNTKIILRPAREDEASAESEDAASEEVPTDAHLPARLRRWKRPAAAFWLGATNRGIIRRHWGITSDKTFKGRASEFGFGVGGFADFAVPGTYEATALRFRVGATHVSITPKAALLDDVSAVQLETGATILHFAAVYKIAPDQVLDWGVPWYGAVVQMNHAFSTSWGSQGGVGGVSKVRGSYGLSVGAAGGLEMPLSATNDLGFEFDWFPWVGFFLGVSMRTSL